MALRFRPRGSEPAPGDLTDDRPDRDHRAHDGDRAEPSHDGDTGSDETPDSPADLSKPSLKAVLRRARGGFKEDHLTDLAAALTYYAVLSIVPALIVLLSVLGLLGPDATSQVLSQVEALAPGSAASFVETLISQAQANRTGAGLGAIVGVLVALWSASGYVSAFMRASNIIYDIGEGRPIWKTLPIRVGVTVFAVVVLFVSAVIVVVSGPVARQIGDVIGVGDTTVLLWGILKWPVLVVLISVLLAVLFWASPNAKQAGIKWVSPGGLIAVLLWMVVSGIFAVYVANFSSYDKTYGSMAGVVIFLVWLWLSNIAILLGAEINAELDHGKAIEEGLPPDAAPFALPRDTRKLDAQEQARLDEVAAQREG
ncbi:MAG: YihY/virulence factor BrkB family protein [Lapillicoccus sp.]